MSGSRSKQAQQEAQCVICDTLISVGDEIWPILKPPAPAAAEAAVEGEAAVDDAAAAEGTEEASGSPAAAAVYAKGAFSWVHVGCAGQCAGGLIRPLCPYWCSQVPH